MHKVGYVTYDSGHGAEVRYFLPLTGSICGYTVAYFVYNAKHYSSDFWGLLTD